MTAQKRRDSGEHTFLTNKQDVKLKKHIPNIITSCNLVSGCIATCFAFQGRASLALLFIVVGAAFDFFDGMSARLLKVSSPIGKELDSLADVVTFGVAPSTMIFFHLSTADLPSVLEPCRGILPFLAYVMAAFSALRLAKFNLDERQALGFIGMPTPANALFWASLLVSMPSIFDGSWGALSVVLLMLLCSWLLVSEIPMFALKFKHWGIADRGNMLKYGFIAFSLMALLIGRVAAVPVIIVVYVLLSSMLALFHAPAAGSPE